MAPETRSPQLLVVSHETKEDKIIARLNELTENHQELSIGRLRFNRGVVDALADAILRHGPLERIVLRNISGDVEGAVEQCMIEGRTKEFQLVHHSSSISESAWRAVSRNLANASGALQCLRLTTYMNLSETKTLCKGLKTSHLLETLDLSWSLINSEAVQELGNAFRENTSLRLVRFMGCSLNDQSVATIADSLKNHPKIESLDLNGNRSLHLECKSIATLLRCSTTLVDLNLSLQRTILRSPTTMEISEISSAIAINLTLQVLDLTGNSFNDNDVQLLVKALQKNRTLQRLELARNKIGDPGIKSIAESLPKMEGLRQISLWGNSFGEKGANALADGLEFNYEMEKLDLGHQFPCSDRIYFFELLNRAGRRLLRNPVADVPLGLWPHVLERISRIHLAERSKILHEALLFYMMYGPAVFHA